jgi:hypothetical protein
MKNTMFCLLLLALACTTGCDSTTRSISHSGYRKAGDYYTDSRAGSTDPAFEYRGELTEFDVLGIARGELTSEASIRRALDDAKKVRLRQDSSILVIQSGALFPDNGMIHELEQHFRVMPFSGVPPHEPAASDPETFAKSLRLAAARAGNDIILCYWGMLECESGNLPTKTISWLPVANWVLPDEKQKMRIRLKLALVDVRSGSWAVFTPPPFEDTLVSERKHRMSADQAQVEKLKLEAYQAGVTNLLKLYAGEVAAR